MTCSSSTPSARTAPTRAAPVRPCSPKRGATSIRTPSRPPARSFRPSFASRTCGRRTSRAVRRASSSSTSSAERVIISGEQHPTRTVGDRTEAKVDGTLELPFESTDAVRYNRTVIKLLPLVALVIIIATYLRRAPVHHHGPHSSRCERRRARARRAARAGGACEGRSYARASRTKSHRALALPSVGISLSSAGGFVSKIYQQLVRTAYQASAFLGAMPQSSTSTPSTPAGFRAAAVSAGASAGQRGGAARPHLARSKLETADESLRRDNATADGAPTDADSYRESVEKVEFLAAEFALKKTQEHESAPSLANDLSPNKWASPCLRSFGSPSMTLRSKPLRMKRRSSLEISRSVIFTPHLQKLSSDREKVRRGLGVHARAHARGWSALRSAVETARDGRTAARRARARRRSSRRRFRSACARRRRSPSRRARSRAR